MKKFIGFAMGFLLLVCTAAGSEGDARFYGGSYDGWGRDAMAHAWTLDDRFQISLWSGTDQIFDWSASKGALASVSVGAWRTLNAITNGGTLSIRLPSGWQSHFDGGAEIVLSGSADGKVGVAAYSADHRAVIIPVTADFVDGDILTVSGLKLMDLRLAHGDAGYLGLDITEDATVDVYDENTLQIRVAWSGGINDGWGKAVSEASGFWLPRGTLISLY